MEPAAKPAKRLRTKMYYLAGRDHVDFTEGSPSAQYWCALGVRTRQPPSKCYPPWARWLPSRPAVDTTIGCREVRT